MKAFDVFVQAIRYIKDHMTSNVTNKGLSTINPDKDIHWLLTVPAIWNDLSKRFMREAAVEVD